MDSEFRKMDKKLKRLAKASNEVANSCPLVRNQLGWLWEYGLERHVTRASDEPYIAGQGYSDPVGEVVVDPYNLKQRERIRQACRQMDIALRATLTAKELLRRIVSDDTRFDYEALEPPTTDRVLRSEYERLSEAAERRDSRHEGTGKYGE